MGISFNASTRMFHLRAGLCSYILQVVDEGYLAHRFFGGQLVEDRLAQPLMRTMRPFSPSPEGSDTDFSLDTLPQEYPYSGRGDFRTPAIEIQTSAAGETLDLRYIGHRIAAGKISLPGLPATYVEDPEEGQTLEIDLVDGLTGLRVVLRYTAFVEHSVIARSVTLINEGENPIKIERIMSASLDLADAEYDWIHLAGAWGRERHPVRERLGPGVRQVESRRGASSHQANPAAVFARPGVTESHGEAWAIALVYSGNFSITVDVNQYQNTRVMAGIHPSGFSWSLLPEASFHAPEVLLSFSDAGLGALSRGLHKLIRTRLASGAHRDRLRPILLNNWEATYFQFDRASLVDLGRSGAELGIELFVLDDGWFGHRDDDTSSLGDWVVDLRKLPDGLEDVSSELQRLGLQFGLWFEPEMVSSDSDLYRLHPDWCLHVPGRSRSLGRHQLVLDYSRDDVCDYVTEALSDILSKGAVTYVKWDMNRNMTEVGSALLPAARQGETAHRYMLGLYAVMAALTSRFPHVLFESCSGGGGRFDLGMLHFMPQVWTSDNTDAIDRLPIQFGTSLIYPSSAMGAHVSAVPNHQVGRITPLETRGFVAMMGNLGYELDVRQSNEEDRAIIRDQICLYKEIRPLVLFGDLYRLRDPKERNDAAWMYVSEDKGMAFATFIRILARANPPLETLRFCGLDPLQHYHIRLIGGDGLEHLPLEAVTLTTGGDELMSVGVVIPPLTGDYRGCAWRITAI